MQGHPSPFFISQAHRNGHCFQQAKGKKAFYLHFCGNSTGENQHSYQSRRPIQSFCHLHQRSSCSFGLFFFKDFIYLFLEREERREKERERNINVLPLARPQLGTWPATQACALKVYTIRYHNPEGQACL